MLTNKKIALAVKIALAYSSVVSFSFSQAATTQSADNKPIENIKVTGSRIQRAELTTANPVQIISAAEIKQTGINNVGDLLQEIPAVAGAATNTSINNGGSGAVRVSLRGIGSQYTLVLINGRRIVASGTGANNSVDLGNIPTAIIKRIEILKDGASAVYGSEAIGGVVNIITRNDFDGAEFNISSDQSTHSGDGAVRTVDFTIGNTSDKGALIISGFYAEQEAQWSGDREWSKFDLGLNPFTGKTTPGGSSAAPWSRLNGVPSVIDGVECTSVTHGAINGPGQSEPTQFSNPTAYECWDENTDNYNYAPANYHLTPNERLGVFVTAQYELGEAVNFFSELAYTNSSAKTLLAPIPLAPLAFFNQTAPYTADNYYNQVFGPKNVDGETVQINDWRRRVIETGGRNTVYELNNTRVVFGIDGQLFDTDWAYEVSYIYGRNQASTIREGGVNFEKVALATGPSFLDSTTGDIVCGTEDAPIVGCVSLNIFGIPGSESQISEEMLKYISFEAHDVGVNEQKIMSAAIFGNAFDLPAGSVGLALGIEHREESGADYPDALIASGVSSGNSRTATQGSYSVDEIYVETTLPILTDMAFAESLEVDVAVRYSDYDTFGSTSNYKVGVKWFPIHDFMIRSTYSSAFRAPSTSDLYAGKSDNSPEVEDPCATNPTVFCIADGVPPEGFEPIGDQLSSTRGGNAKLEPEEADNFTMGVVYIPAQIEHLDLTIDFWKIKLSKAISTIGESIILANCAASGEYCDKITRFGPETGGLYGNSSNIDNKNTNVGGIESSGFDFNVRYALATELGRLSTNLDATFYDTYNKTLADGKLRRHAGWFIDNGGDGNFPKWKTNATVGLANIDWAVAYTLRYIHSVEERFTTVDADEISKVHSAFRTELNAQGKYDVIRKISSQLIHDLRFSYFYKKYQFSLGIDNVFDAQPPYAASGFNDNTDPRTYNTTGRHWTIGLSANF